MSLEEVLGTGARPLTSAEVKEVVTGAKAEFTLVNGSVRHWAHAPDGTFVASRDTVGSRAMKTRRPTAVGTWSINDDGAYCLTFDWGSADTESWCRLLYRVEDRYYAFGSNAGPETKSGRYRFSK